MPLYDAFVSYSHAKDKPVAAALQSVIQKLGKPWYRRRMLRVFRDDTSLAATPELWPTLEKTLDQSRFILVLASPEFARSKWCGMEVAHWLKHKSLDTFLIAVTDGELRWDEAAGDFIWDEKTPLPAVLKGHWKNEPKWIDLRSWREAPDASDPKFVDAAADLAAAVHGLPKEDLLSQEVRQQKRALRLAWSAAASLTLLAGGAGWQWYEAEAAKRAALSAEQQAIAQRDRAERNLTLARRSADNLVSRIAQGMRNAQGMRVATIRQLLGTAQDVMDEIARDAPDDPALRLSRAAMLGEFVETYAAAGETERARTAATEAVSILRQIAASSSEPKMQTLLSNALDRLGGTLQATADLSGAAKAYEESLSIRRRLLASDDSNAGARGAIASSLNRLGLVRMDGGRYTDALPLHEEALKIHRELASFDAKAWQAGLLTSLQRVGRTRATVGDLQGSLGFFQEAVAIARELAAGDDTQGQKELASTLFQMGDSRLFMNDPVGALATYREALGVMRKLSESDPGHAGWRREIGAILLRTGDAYGRAQNVETARKAYQDSLAIARKLVETDPDNAAWQADLFYNLNRLGNTFTTMGDTARATEAYDEGLAIVRKLSAADARNPVWRRFLRDELAEFAQRRRGQKDFAAALAASDESLSIAKELVAADRDNVATRRDLIIGLYAQAGLRAEAGERVGALAAYEEALALLTTHPQPERDAPQWQIYIVRVLHGISQSASPPRAREALRQALEIVGRIAAAGALPDAQRGWPDALRQPLSDLPRESTGAK